MTPTFSRNSLRFRTVQRIRPRPFPVRGQWRLVAMVCPLLVLVTAAALGEPPAEPTTQRDPLAEPTARRDPLDGGAIRPKPVIAPTAEEVRQAIGRGINFLLADQNSDGSWGTAGRTKELNIYAPVPGAHLAFRAATTSLCVTALIDSRDPRPEVQTAIDKGETWLLKELPRVRRATADAIYNNWAHGYGVSALVRMHQRAKGNEPRQQQIRDVLRQQIALLGRYESVDGGWGYYDFRAGTQRPAASSTSFITATVLIALREAQAIGVEAPKEVVERAIASIHRQQKSDYSYIYGEYLKYRPMHPVNRPGGSLGRSQVCNLALRIWGDPKISDQVLTTWLDRLFARNLWLDIGRKRPIPHESWFAVAGYFYYYGHYYAAGCIAELPPDQREAHFAQLNRLLLDRQESDGSWWDYPFYNYHQQYGTALAVQTLLASQAPLSRRTIE